MHAGLRSHRGHAATFFRVFLFLSLILGARTVHADSAGRAAKEKEAKRACLTGDPTKGVAILTDLYLDTNNPTFIYNQGRCFEQNRRYEDAIGRFREYLVKAKHLSVAERADTESHIAACQSYLHEKVAPAAQPEPAPGTNPPPSAEPPALQPQPAEGAPLLTEAPATSPKTASRGSGLRVAGLVVTAVGAAGALTGLILNLQANKMASDVEKNYNTDTDSKRKSYETWGWVGYGAGAACVVGGAILYVVGWRMGANSSVALVPSLGSGIAGATLSGAF